MAQTNVDTAPATLYAMLVTFTWGDSHVARYARYDTSITVGADTFTAQPTLEFKPSDQQGTVKDDPWVITLDSRIAPINTYARRFPHAPVDVLIQEIEPGDASTLRTLFRGELGGFDLNADGKPFRCRCRVLSAKSLYSLPLGIPATTTCPWTLGDQQCQKDISGLILTGEITNLQQSGKITYVLTDLTDSPTGLLENVGWRTGFLEYDGLTIMIRKSFQNGVFALVVEPPPEWLNTGTDTITFNPGCDGLLRTCRNEYDNEEFFGGIAIGIQNRNPVLDEPANDDQAI